MKANRRCRNWSGHCWSRRQPAGRRDVCWADVNMTVVLVDGNREALQPQQWQQLEQLPKTNFGPIHLYFASR